MKVLIVTLLLATNCFMLNSCRTYSVSNSSLLDNEIKLYGFKENDTILDFSVGQMSILPLAAITTNNLHFYLGYAPKNKAVSKTITQRQYERLKKEFNSNNDVTFLEVKQNGDSVFLPNGSITHILCRDNLYMFNDLYKITSEFHRVLKNDGHIIILQRLLDQDELSKKDLKILKDYPSPNAASLISYFKAARFKFIKSERIVLNKRMEKVTSGRETLFHFEKEASR